MSQINRVPTWISVDWDLPNVNANQLVFDGLKITIGWYVVDNKEWRSDANKIVEPTHWMPLPETPNDD